MTSPLLPVPQAPVLGESVIGHHCVSTDPSQTAPTSNKISSTQYCYSTTRVASLETHRKPLCAWFTRRTRNLAEAEDLTAETLLTALEKYGDGATSSNDVLASSSVDVSAPADFKALLYKIAEFKLNNWLRMKGRRRTCELSSLLNGENEEGDLLEAGLGADTDGDPLTILLDQEGRESLYYALADVGMNSPDQFQALFLHYLCDLPYKQIAYLFDAEDVSSQLQLGRRSMQRHYERRSIEAPVLSVN